VRDKAVVQFFASNVHFQQFTTEEISTTGWNRRSPRAVHLGLLAEADIRLERNVPNEASVAQPRTG
jgi:hypothetical protein